MCYSYWMENSELMVAKTATGALVWRGKPEDQTVQKVLPLSATPGCLVLLANDAYLAGRGYGDSTNLVRCTAEGGVLWRAAVPDPGTNDSYTDVWEQNGKISAFSWSCYSVQIDLENGNILSKVFTK